MACAFCATARMPTRRNLATWEIVDQWVQARDLARLAGPAGDRGGLHGDGRAVPQLRPGDRRRRAAPMPLRRLDRRRRRSRSAPSAWSPRSTATPPKGTATGSRSAWGPRPTRSGPSSSRSPPGWPIAEVMAAARRHALDRRDRVMLSYVCIAGENVGEDDARALGELIGDTPVRLDLIDVTDPTGRFQPALARGDVRLPRRPEPPRRPAGGPPLLRRQGHPGRLRDPGGLRRSARTPADPVRPSGSTSPPGRRRIPSARSPAGGRRTACPGRGSTRSRSCRRAHFDDRRSSSRAPGRSPGRSAWW